MNDLLTNKINKIKEEYKIINMFYSTKIVIDLIKQLGATEKDIDTLIEYGDYLAQSYYCRFVTLSRTLPFSIMRAKTISRLEYQPFVLTEDGFIREDSGAQRHFRAIDDHGKTIPLTKHY